MSKFSEMEIFDIKNTELDGMPIDHNLKEIDVSNITDGIGFDTESKKHLTEIIIAVISLSLVLVCLTFFVTWLVMRNKKASPIFSVTLPNDYTKSPKENETPPITLPSDGTAPPKENETPPILIDEELGRKWQSVRETAEQYETGMNKLVDVYTENSNILEKCANFNLNIELLTDRLNPKRPLTALNLEELNEFNVEIENIIASINELTLTHGDIQSFNGVQKHYKAAVIGANAFLKAMEQVQSINVNEGNPLQIASLQHNVTKNGIDKLAAIKDGATEFIEKGIIWWQPSEEQQATKLDVSASIKSGEKCLKQMLPQNSPLKTAHDLSQKIKDEINSIKTLQAQFKQLEQKQNNINEKIQIALKIIGESTSQFENFEFTMEDDINTFILTSDELNDLLLQKKAKFDETIEKIEKIEKLQNFQSDIQAFDDELNKISENKNFNRDAVLGEHKTQLEQQSAAMNKNVKLIIDAQKSMAQRKDFINTGYIDNIAATIDFAGKKMIDFNALLKNFHEKQQEIKTAIANLNTVEKDDLGKKIKNFIVNINTQEDITGKEEQLASFKNSVTEGHSASNDMLKDIKEKEKVLNTIITAINNAKSHFDDCVMKISKFLKSNIVLAAKKIDTQFNYFKTNADIIQNTAIEYAPVDFEKMSKDINQTQKELLQHIEQAESKIVEAKNRPENSLPKIIANPPHAYSTPVITETPVINQSPNPNPTSILHPTMTRKSVINQSQYPSIKSAVPIPGSQKPQSKAVNIPGKSSSVNPQKPQQNPSWTLDTKATPDFESRDALLAQIKQDSKSTKARWKIDGSNRQNVKAYQKVYDSTGNFKGFTDCLNFPVIIEGKTAKTKLYGRQLPAHVRVQKLEKTLAPVANDEQLPKSMQNTKLYTDLPVQFYNKLLESLSDPNINKFKLFPLMNEGNRKMCPIKTYIDKLDAKIFAVSKWQSLGWTSQQEYENWLNESALGAFNGCGHYCEVLNIFDYVGTDENGNDIFVEVEDGQQEKVNIFSLTGFELRSVARMDNAVENDPLSISAAAQLQQYIEEKVFVDYSTASMQQIFAAANDNNVTDVVLVPYGMGVFLNKHFEVKEQILAGWIDALQNYSGRKLTIHCCLLPNHFNIIKEKLSNVGNIELVNEEGYDVYVIAKKIMQEDSNKKSMIVNAGDIDWINASNATGHPGQACLNHHWDFKTCDEYLGNSTEFSLTSIANMKKCKPLSKCIRSTNIQRLPTDRRMNPTILNEFLKLNKKEQTRKMAEELQKKHSRLPLPQSPLTQSTPPQSTSAQSTATQNTPTQITPPQSTSSQNIPFQTEAPQTEISVDELISEFENMDKTTNTWEPTIKLLTTKQFIEIYENLGNVNDQKQLSRENCALTNACQTCRNLIHANSLKPNSTSSLVSDDEELLNDIESKINGDNLNPLLLQQYIDKIVAKRRSLSQMILTDQEFNKVNALRERLNATDFGPAYTNALKVAKEFKNRLEQWPLYQFLLKYRASQPENQTLRKLADDLNDRISTINNFLNSGMVHWNERYGVIKEFNVRNIAAVTQNFEEPLNKVKELKIRAEALAKSAQNKINEINLSSNFAKFSSKHATFNVEQLLEQIDSNSSNENKENVKNELEKLGKIENVQLNANIDDLNELLSQEKNKLTEAKEEINKITQDYMKNVTEPLMKAHKKAKKHQDELNKIAKINDELLESASETKKPEFVQRKKEILDKQKEVMSKLTQIAAAIGQLNITTEIAQCNNAIDASYLPNIKTLIQMAIEKIGTVGELLNDWAKKLEEAGPVITNNSEDIISKEQELIRIAENLENITGPVGQFISNIKNDPRIKNTPELSELFKELTTKADSKKDKIKEALDHPFVIKNKLELICGCKIENISEIFTHSQLKQQRKNLKTKLRQSAEYVTLCDEIGKNTEDLNTLRQRMNFMLSANKALKAIAQPSLDTDAQKIKRIRNLITNADCAEQPYLGSLILKITEDPQNIENYIAEYSVSALARMHTVMAAIEHKINLLNIYSASLPGEIYHENLDKVSCLLKTEKLTLDCLPDENRQELEQYIEFHNKLAKIKDLLRNAEIPHLPSDKNSNGSYMNTVIQKIRQLNYSKQKIKCSVPEFIRKMCSASYTSNNFNNFAHTFEHNMKKLEKHLTAEQQSNLKVEREKHLIELQNVLAEKPSVLLSCKLEKLKPEKIANMLTTRCQSPNQTQHCLEQAKNFYALTHNDTSKYYQLLHEEMFQEVQKFIVPQETQEAVIPKIKNTIKYFKNLFKDIKKNKEEATEVIEKLFKKGYEYVNTIRQSYSENKFDDLEKINEYCSNVKILDIIKEKLSNTEDCCKFVMKFHGTVADRLYSLFNEFLSQERQNENNDFKELQEKIEKISRPDSGKTERELETSIYNLKYREYNTCEKDTFTLMLNAYYTSETPNKKIERQVYRFKKFLETEKYKNDIYCEKFDVFLKDFKSCLEEEGIKKYIELLNVKNMISPYCSKERATQLEEMKRFCEEKLTTYEQKTELLTDIPLVNSAHK